MRFNLSIVLVLVQVFCSSSQGIPQYLIPCYRSNNTDNYVAQSNQVFLELIRKIEDALPTSLDIRTLSASLFHRLRFDGIQKAVGISETQLVTPYRNNGIMAAKLELLKRLISVRSNVSFENLLTQAELCALHKLISSSVEPFERGDETRTCPTYSMASVDAPWITGNIKMINDSFRVGYGDTTRNIVKYGRGVSKCPLEMGVAQTDYYGDISLGTLIGAIAAGLEPQTVQITDLIGEFRKFSDLESMDEVPRFAELFRNLNTIDNQLASGLAGDLAEVCVYQTPFVGGNFVIGTTGMWNDTTFPRMRYLEENHRARWEFTEAEIMSGIDSFFIGKHVQEWINQLRRLRLSQVVEMYYHARGIPIRAIETHGHKSKSFGNMKEYVSLLEQRSESMPSNAEISSACNRIRILEGIDVGRLQDETFHLAQVLQFTARSLYIREDKLRSSCDQAVNVFMARAKRLLEAQTSCNNIPKEVRESVLDLQLSVDGSRSEYENLQLINHIAHNSRVSTFGTNITVIHGTTGEIISNRTNSIFNTFEQIKNSTSRNPTTMNLSAVLQTVLNTLRAQTAREMTERRICAPSHVILIMAQGSRVASADFTSAQRMITTTFQQFPDLYFIFVTNDKRTFLDLTQSITAPSHWSGNLERFNELVYPEHFVIIESNARSPDEFTERLVKEFKRIPKRIFAPYCLDETDRQRLQKQNILFRPDEFEDFVSPNQEVLYRISPYYFRYSKEIQILFNGVGYGDLTICQSRNLMSKADFCQTVKGNDVAMFNATQPCPDPTDCQSIYFSVAVDVSRMRCTENDCRYPDQVRYIIRHSGLTCRNYAPLTGGFSSVTLIITSISLLIVQFFLPH